MATPTYFKEFPNVKDASKIDHAGRPSYIEMKDYFRRMKVRDDIFKEDTLYTEYEIKNYERPDQISYELYNDEQYYWTILQTNNIVDYYNQWPLDQVEFEEFMLRKYKTRKDTQGVHHYETENIYEWETFMTDFPDEAALRKGQKEGRVIVFPGGMVVPKDYNYPRNLNISNRKPVEITNWVYESRKNDEKRHIMVIDPKYIIDYVREYDNYAKSLDDSQSSVTIADVNLF